jgi:hypothetical protein
MAVMVPREKWTDDRLDDLAKKVDDGFARTDKKIDNGFGKVDKRLETIEERFGNLERALLHSAVGVIGTLIVCCATLVGVAVL